MGYICAHRNNLFFKNDLNLTVNEFNSAVLVVLTASFHMVTHSYVS